MTRGTERWGSCTADQWDDFQNPPGGRDAWLGKHHCLPRMTFLGRNVYNEEEIGSEISICTALSNHYDNITSPCTHTQLSYCLHDLSRNSHPPIPPLTHNPPHALPPRPIPHHASPGKLNPYNHHRRPSPISTNTYTSSISHAPTQPSSSVRLTAPTAYYAGSATPRRHRRPACGTARRWCLRWH